MSTTKAYHANGTSILNITSYDTQMTEQPPVYTFVTIVLFSAGVWIILTNIMIVVAPFVNSALKQKTCVFISSLALADIFTACCVPASWTIFYLKFINKNVFFKIATDTLCKVRLAFIVFPLSCSIFNLFLISLDRFIAIVYPMKYHIVLTKRTVYISCVSAWMFAALIAFLVVLGGPNYETSGEMCKIKNLRPLFIHFCLGTIFWIVTLLMLMIYIKIYVVMKKSSRDSMKRCSRHNTFVTEKKVAQMVFISMGTFLACWGPFFIIFQLYLENIVSSYVFTMFCVISYCNSGMNFFIYATRSDKYRKAFRIICCLCKKRKSEEVITLNQITVHRPTA